MNQKQAKKLRKLSKRNWIEYVQEVKKWPFEARWRLAWYILFGKAENGGKKK